MKKTTKLVLSVRLDPEAIAEIERIRREDKDCPSVAGMARKMLLEAIALRKGGK